MAVSWKLCFLNLVTFVFLYVCTPSLWAVYAHSWPWHVWKAQMILDLYIFLHGDSGFSLLIGIAQKFHFCLNLSCQGDVWWLAALCIVVLTVNASGGLVSLFRLCTYPLLQQSFSLYRNKSWWNLSYPVSCQEGYFLT